MEHSFFDPELGALAEIAEALEAVMVGTYTVTTACTWTGMYNGAQLNLSFSVGTLTPTAQQQYALDNFIVPASYAANPDGQTGPAATPVTPAPPVTAGWTLQANGTGGTTFAAPGASSALNLPRVINITDSTWGFVGDGATDNGSKWTALNTALAGYSGTQQVIVYAPAGTYMSSVTPKLPSTSALRRRRCIGAHGRGQHGDQRGGLRRQFHPRPHPRHRHRRQFGQFDVSQPGAIHRLLGGLRAAARGRAPT